MKRMIVVMLLIAQIGCTGDRMSTSVCTHMMFQGSASEAINLYGSVFEEFKVQDLQKYGREDGQMDGKIKMARVKFAEHDLLIIDSPPVHEFTFTPSMSLFVQFESANELDRAFNRLSEDGEVFMPLDDYGFSPRFGFVKDRYGVSWQLGLKLYE